MKRGERVAPVQSAKNTSAAATQTGCLQAQHSRADASIPASAEADLKAFKTAAERNSKCTKKLFRRETGNCLEFPSAKTCFRVAGGGKQQFKRLTNKNQINQPINLTTLLYSKQRPHILRARWPISQLPHIPAFQQLLIAPCTPYKSQKLNSSFRKIKLELVKLTLIKSVISYMAKICWDITKKQYI